MSAEAGPQRLDARWRWLVVGALLILSWSAMWPWPYLPLVAAAAGLPLAVIVFWCVTDRPALSDLQVHALRIVAGGGAVVLGYRAMFDVDLIDGGEAFALALFFGWVFAVFSLWSERRRRILRALVAGWMLGFAYVFGCVALGNSLFEQRQPRLYSANVTGKSSNRSSYRLDLGSLDVAGVPAGPSVSPALYAQVKEGDQVCIGVYPGGFGLRWYDVMRCPWDARLP